jgi:hypothetical protein
MRYLAIRRYLGMQSWLEFGDLVPAPATESQKMRATTESTRDYSVPARESALSRSLAEHAALS